jgi:hypothetical protein
MLALKTPACGHQAFSALVTHQAREAEEGTGVLTPKVAGIEHHLWLFVVKRLHRSKPRRTPFREILATLLVARACFVLNRGLGRSDL